MSDHANEIELKRAKSGIGGKADRGKLRMSLFPVEALVGTLEVLELGAAKYSPDNWKKVPNARERYYDAAMRHLLAWKGGEKLDPETGKSHIHHVACCVAFLQWFEESPDAPVDGPQ